MNTEMSHVWMFNVQPRLLQAVLQLFGVCRSQRIGRAVHLDQQSLFLIVWFMLGAKGFLRLKGMVGGPLMDVPKGLTDKPIKS